MYSRLFPAVSIALALILQLSQVAVAEKKSYNENWEDLTEVSKLILATAGAHNYEKQESKVLPEGMSSRSVSAFNIPSGQECSNYTNLTNPDRAQRAVTFDQQLCDNGSPFVSGWYRFAGDAGDKMASTCVPIVHCTTAAPGWLNGSHPVYNFSLARRRVCFHWQEKCCRYEVNIWVRNCGGFYVYQLPKTPICNLRYCGNAVGPLKNPSQCGGNLTSLSGQITSPGYPNYMEPITCHWTINAPVSDGKILLYFEDMTFSHQGCPSNNITIAGNTNHTFCGKREHRFHLFVAKRIVDIHYQSVYWNKISGFKVRYAVVKENLENVKTISTWNISVEINGSSAIEVSWQAFDDLDGNKYVYGYVVVCKPANQQPVYVLTEANASTIIINGLSGGTEYKVQVVALVNDRNARSPSLNGSVIVKVFTEKGECTHFTELTAWDRAQGAPSGSYCDQWNIVTPAWYRFAGRAGTQIASSCVPKRRCGTAATGWMDGAHPSVQDGIVIRAVCFHWFEDCCKWHVNIKVRNCGGFYVYQLQRPPFCDFRYCGNEGSCGKSVNDTTGIVTSPGYPTRIYWDSKCQWNFTAPSPSSAIVVIVEHLSLPKSARCLKFSLSFENNDRKQVGKECGAQTFFTWVSQGSAQLKFFSGRAASRWVGFKARYFIFDNSLTDIPGISHWTGVSAHAINSTAIDVQWGPYPTSSVNSPVTEYLIICVPDGLPLNATVFTTDVSKTSTNVTGLMKYTNYTVQVVINTNQNVSSSFDGYRRSRRTRVKTNEDVPSEGPQKLTAVATSDTRITVSWQPIPEHARHGVITSYIIYYKKASTSDNYITETVSSNLSKAVLKDLEPVTEYRIEVAGATSVGVGTKSRTVFATTGCAFSKQSSKNLVTWTFTSPWYPAHYPSEVNCTWSVTFIGKKEKVYIIFDDFNLEIPDKAKPCSDHVSVKQANGKTTRLFCGKKDPFAIRVTTSPGVVKFNSDKGVEESGFQARVFVASTKIQVTFLHSATNGVIVIKHDNTLRWLEPKTNEDIIEYVVLYSRDNNDMVWNASITNTTKVILTGLDPNIEEYFIILLFRTRNGKVYYDTIKMKLEESKVTPSPMITEPPTMQGSTVYPYGADVGDKMVPNTRDFSTRCFRIDIPDDGMQFFEKRHHMIHICRNGLLLFETEHLIRWPRRFSERDSPYNKTAIIAPYWALTDVEDAFVIHNISKVFYQVYDNSNEGSKIMLQQATYDVNVFHTEVSHLYSKSSSKPKNFEAKWILVVTWVNLRPPNAHNMPSSLKNTFQVVLITDGLYSFVMFNYPPNGIKWSAPTQEKYYEYYTYYRGLPVVGLNGGENKHEYYHVKGSGETGIVNINSRNGKTIRTTDACISDKCYYEKDLRPGKWFYRVETAVSSTVQTSRCKKWLKSELDHKRFTEHLEPCPCTYRQASWDERFRIDPYGWPFICAHSVFGSIDGWNQMCCYNTILGALVKGHPGGGFPFSSKNLPYTNKNYDKTAFAACCVSLNQCKLFYKKRPSDDCKRYKETEWSWLWGDPHFVTLDGLNYTFNGLGEYIMADINDGLFQLQARTQLVAGGGKATVFVAAVAKQTGSSAVQVNLKPGQGLEVLVNGTVLDHTTLTNTSTLYNGSVALSRHDPRSITVLFPSGISVKMTDVKDSLAIVLAAPERFKNKTRGLLGVWNDDPEDDLTTPTGRVLPTNATGRMIHYDFGQLWQVTESTSLFTYKHGESVHTFANSSFEPMFIEDFKFANDTVRQEALAKCEGDVNCLYDAALTNDVTVGTSTKIVGSKLKNESEALKNAVPLFLNDSSTFYVTVNTTARIGIFANDTDGDPLTFDVSGILPENLTRTDSERGVVISWKVTMDKIQFEITVMDDKGASALLRPEVHVCACHNGGYCSPDSNNNVFADSTNDTFVIMPCTCIHGYTGRFCEKDLDACQANFNPCYPSVQCTDLPPPQGVSGYKCGPCPSGFTGDGALCLDLDECDKVNQGCSQVCVNTPGSFVCDCNQGYRLSIDQKTCNDIDECYPSSDCMQKCTNTAGSYTCECDDGFKVDPHNPKKCVPKLPCTSGNHGCQHICFMKDGRQQCTCHQGYELMDDQNTCKDVDECSMRKYRCNQYCHNTEGSYSCSCKKGFRMDSDGVTCVDVDECMELTYQCPDPSQICLNTAGSYKCVCGPGLFLTVNNTCREIPPGATPPPPGPAPTPKPPTDDEKNNAVRITVRELHTSEWNEWLDKEFKQSVARAVTLYCALKDEECKKDRKRKRRALDYIPHTADQVHLLPGFPIQINLKSRDLAAVIAFYVEFPPEVVSTSGDSIEGGILVDVVRSNKKDIEKALNRTITSITLNKEGTSTKKKPEKFSIYAIIGLSLAGVLFVSVVGVLIKRDTTHNATLRIKRKQEMEEQRQAANVYNACYDDGIPGDFRLGPAQSTTDILRETGNNNVQIAELGIDNLVVDVKQGSHEDTLCA